MAVLVATDDGWVGAGMPIKIMFTARGSTVRHC